MFIVQNFIILWNYREWPSILKVWNILFVFFASQIIWYKMNMAWNNTWWLLKHWSLERIENIYKLKNKNKLKWTGFVWKFSCIKWKLSFESDVEILNVFDIRWGALHYRSAVNVFIFSVANISWKIAVKFRCKNIFESNFVVKIVWKISLFCDKGIKHFHKSELSYIIKILKTWFCDENYLEFNFVLKIFKTLIFRGQK